MNWFEIILNALQSQGYFGMLLIGIFGNMIPFLPVPFLIPVFLLSTVLDPLPLGIAVGVGAAIGKCVSYAIGRGGFKILGEKKQRELNVFSKLLGRYGIIAVLLFATLPLPDDIIVIPFGMMKYSFKKFFAALLVGKITLCLLVAYAGKYSFDFLTFLLGDGNAVVGMIASIIFMALMIIIIMKIDWIEATQHVESKGIWSYIKLLLRRAFRRGGEK